MSQRNKAGHLPQLPKIRLLLPYLTLNRPGFSESSKAGEGQIPPPCVTSILRPMTMKFGGVILSQKLYQELIEHLMSRL